MNTFHTILTHPGGAHKDDFLACCVLLNQYPVAIVRREPTNADLDDLGTCVVDVGLRHEPEQHNFDHHQFDDDAATTCALSLVLQHMGLYEDARRFCAWLEPAEWMDCLGPRVTATRLGAPPAVVNQLLSPIDVTLLRRFAQRARLEPGEPLWEVMKMVGDDLVAYVEGYRQRLAYVAQNAEFWPVTAAGSIHVLFMPRTEPMPKEPSAALELYIADAGGDLDVAGMVYPDRRGSGYGLSRHNDDMRFDFTRIEQADDVHFAHSRGFVAKTTATDRTRLQELLAMALVP